MRRFVLCARLFLCILLFLIFLPSVFGLGIRPAETKADFVPNARATYAFTVVNDEHRDLVVTLEAKGVFADLMSFPRERVEISASQDLAKVDFVVDFPDKMSPGVQEGSVVVSEEGIGYVTQGGIAARLQLVHKVHLNVPLEGKYIVANLKVNEGQEQIDVVTNIQNKGYEKINALTSQVSVLDEDVVLDMLPANSQSLGVKEAVSFQNTLQKSSLSLGEYTVMAEVLYDNARLELSQKLRVGLPTLNIVASDEFVAEGKINKWDVNVKSLWNEVLKDQLFEVVLLKDGGVVDRWKTLAVDIEPGVVKTIRSYVDGTRIPVGDYTAQITALDSTVVLMNSSRVLRMVSENDMPGGGALSTLFTVVIILIVIVLVLVILVIALLVLQRRKPVQQ